MQQQIKVNEVEIEHLKGTKYEFSNKMRDEIRDELISSVRKEVQYAAKNELLSEIKSKIHQEIRHDVRNEMMDELSDKLYNISKRSGIAQVQKVGIYKCPVNSQIKQKQ